MEEKIMVFFDGSKYYKFIKYSNQGRSIIVEKAVKKLKPIMTDYTEEQINEGFLYASRYLGVSVTPKRHILKFLDTSQGNISISWEELAKMVEQKITKYVIVATDKFD
jgi:cell division protein YceG involved in septum cleavage